MLATGCLVCFVRRRACFRRRRREAHVEPLDADVRSQGTPIGAHGAVKAPSAVSGLHPSPDDSALLRSELGRMREELERVRRIAEPPEYTHVPNSS